MPAQPVYVLSYGTAQVLRYNGTTGAFVSVVIPFAPTVGLEFRPDGNLYVGYWTPSTGARINRYNSSTFAFVDTFASWGGDPVAPFTFNSSGEFFGASYFSGVITAPAAGGTFSVLVPAGTGGLIGASDVQIGSDGNLYVASFNSDEVLRYNAVTGAFIDAFVPAGTGGLSGTQGLLFHKFQSSPADQIQSLITSTLMTNFASNIQSQLDAKLNAAVATLDAAKNNSTATAANQLQAFVNAVSADVQSGKITCIQGTTLVSAAQAIVAALGQPPLNVSLQCQ